MPGQIVKAGRTTSRRKSRLKLEDGARIAVIGGGPAGSFFSIFALEMAARVGLDLTVDLFEPRDFRVQGPPGCNMCGGIISESLVQHLAAEGLALPPTVIQRGIDSYVLHTDVGDVRIETPMLEKRIGAVHRGLGPRTTDGARYESFDAFLLSHAEARGARVIRRRVDQVSREEGFPVIPAEDGTPVRYDLLVLAGGVNAGPPKFLGELGLGKAAPRTTKTVIREYLVGRPVIRASLGDSMHVFLLNLPRLEFAAFIPKGEYVSLCLLGEEIDRKLLDAFLGASEVVACMPPGWEAEQHACKCAPKMNVGWSGRPYGERVVLIGDSGVARLYKDGIGSAYRTAKAAAAAAVFEGVSSEDFRLRYSPTCNSIALDNALGRLVFMVVRQIQKHRFARCALLDLVAREQADRGRPARMSTVLWDTFTGSAPYREIFLRALHPALLVRLGLALAAALARPGATPGRDDRAGGGKAAGAGRGGSTEPEETDA
jgi:flavin-dependent dehydrogenase